MVEVVKPCHVFERAWLPGWINEKVSFDCLAPLPAALKT
jgi:hypothetical protein